MSGVLERAIAHFEARPRKKVACPEWGCEVWFRTPNAATLSQVVRESKGDPIEQAARLVAHCARLEDDTPMFARLDYKTLMIQVDPAVVSRIANAMMDEAKIDVEAAEKN
jgi:hypothetical protein